MGVTLPRFSEDDVGNLASHVQHAEEVGLESVWVGDHLIPVVPFPAWIAHWSLPPLLLPPDTSKSASV
ncbi:hypothetical protein KSC_031230 [Ktedonobacter sp. SOSP1-52]|nr:hypothetical protein KSC_031230 [Ktedonobacter sp. SOSP1-52]